MPMSSARRPRARHLLVATVALGALVAGACSSEDLREGGIPTAAAPVPTLTSAQVEGSQGQLDRIVGDVMDTTGIPGVAGKMLPANVAGEPCRPTNAAFVVGL